MIIRSKHFLLSVLQDQDILQSLNKLQLMRHQDHQLMLERALNTLAEDEVGDAGVHCREGIVQEVDVCVGVDGAG